MKEYLFISTFWFVLPFFVIGSVLMVMDLSNMAKGEDVKYFWYFVLNFGVYITLRIIFRKREVERVQDDTGKNIYFNSDSKVVHRDDE